MAVRKPILLALVLVLSFSGAGLAQDADYAYRQAASFAREVKSNAGKRQLRHYWTRAIERLQDVADKYPRSERAPEALFLIGTLYEEMSQVSLISDDVDSAIGAYRKLVKNYPSHRLADDAQFYLARLLRDRKNDRTAAYVEFEKVTTLYARGDMAASAGKELAKLADAKPAPGAEKSASLANVAKILHWSNKNYTRIAIYLGDKATYKYGLLAEDDKAQKPRRLYVDIAGARLDSALKEPIPIGDGLLTQARAAQYAADTVRVVLDMKSVGDFKVFPLVSPFRIIVDVYGAEPAPLDATAGVAESPLPPVEKPEAAPELRMPPADEKPVKQAKHQPEFKPVARDVARVPFSYQLGLQVKRVVIDAGHGGKDPGAIGVKRLREKDVALRVAKKLAKKIQSELKLDTVLTRSDDTFVDLEGRPAFAKAERGDLFISIHCNSAPTKDAYGIETYHLDFTSDRRSILVAARENASSERGVSEQEAILRDLVLTSKRNDSIQLARAVQGSLITGLGRKYPRVKDLGVKGAPFVVLIGANIPAVLIEVGFVSNPRESARLTDPKYLDQLTDQIVTGIKKYSQNLQATTF